MEGVKIQKPLKAKPQFYACAFQALQRIARELGYNLIMHGSMERDMDLVAIPWNDNPASHFELLKTFDLHLTGIHKCEEQFPDNYMFSVLPGGRSSYVINLNRGGPWANYTDEQWYLDISITPLNKQPIK